jgi:serine/threonine protein kinase
MPLLSGTRLGPYEIVAPLGAGGMGEVFRATDAVLKRQVALKVLPPEVAGDPERVVAKAMEPVGNGPSSAALANSPTITSPAVMTGARTCQQH